MTNVVLDDFSGKVFNPDDDQMYTIQVKKKTQAEDGKTKTLQLEFQVNHESFMALVGKPFEGKKILSRWSHWENPSDEVKAKYPNARGRWIKEKV